MSDANKKLNSIQAVRAIAFMIIFLTHSNMIDEKMGGFGVSIFIVLSGFVMMYAYWNKAIDITLKNCVEFSFNKIKRLYPLHILMTAAILILALPPLLKGTYESIQLVKEILANVFLVKSFIPKESIYFSLNGVSWYLSVCIVLYILFPFIKNKIERFTAVQAICNIVLAYFIQILITAVLYTIGVDKELITYATYICPLFRCIDFYAGCNLCIIFKKSKHIFEDKIYSAAEFAVMLLAILLSSFLIFANSSNIIIGIFTRSAILFLPVSVLLIYIFAINKGILSKVCTNKLFIYIGDLSPYTFLIHTVVIKYLSIITSHFNIRIEGYIMSITAFLLTIGCAHIYRKIQSSFVSIKRKV